MFPSTVRYIKNGMGGQWWPVALRDHQLHAGWSEISEQLLRTPDPVQIRALYPNTQDFNALMKLLDRPSDHVWITFQSDRMWWCLVDDRINFHGPTTETNGHFSLSCKPNYRWSDRSLKNTILAISDLPGPVGAVKGFQGTVCTPGGRNYIEVGDQILRVIRGEPNPLVQEAAAAKAAYQAVVENMVRALHWKDFELLVSLMLERMGWIRESELGKTQASLDLDVKNLASEERAFVQVKSRAGAADFQNSLAEYKDMPHFSRMIFAVHTPTSPISTTESNVHIWDNPRTSERILHLGLADWIAKRIA